jgi:predicted RecB family endonuclease
VDTEETRHLCELQAQGFNSGSETEWKSEIDILAERGGATLAVEFRPTPLLITKHLR